MSVEFRQRTPSEYLQLIRKRRWLVILPTIAIATAISYVVWKLPNLYESTSLMIVRPSTIPNAIVPTLSEIDLSMRINSIGQEVTSRSSLEPLITKFNLYQSERARNEPMESIVEGMRKAIVVEVDKSRNDVTNAFRISFREHDPLTTQRVTAELAGKYVSAQTNMTTNASSQTRQFFEQQSADKKLQLDEIDRRRLDYMQKNVNNLPSQTASLVGQLNGLREQEKVLIQEVGRLQDHRNLLTNQIMILKKQTEQQIDDVAETTTDPKTTIAYAELAKRKADLEAELQNMLTTLKPKNPDVIAKHAQIDSLQKQIDTMMNDWQARMTSKRERLTGRVDLGVASTESNLKIVENDIARQQKILNQSESQFDELSIRINNIPTTEVGLEALNTEYKDTKQEYDRLVEKKQQAELAADVASNAQGETIQVIDPANTPTAPVAPKRWLLMPLGAVLGLMVGLFLVGAVEVPRLFTIQTAEDVVHYTSLPVLMALPELLTPQEAARVPIRKGLILTAGIIATLVITPCLAILLKMFHVFDRFVA